MPDEQLTDREWFTRHPVEVAWDLIGCVLRIERDGVTVAGRIVETEAYAGPGDPASHASRLKEARTTMAGPPATVYTYLSYGIHTAMNIVAHEDGQSGAVLLRALEPVEGLNVMIERRNGVAEKQVAKGPGSLCKAMGIRLTDIGTDILSSPEFAITSSESPPSVHASPRIGISRAKHVPWRFFEAESPCVSSHRRGCAAQRDDVARLIQLLDLPME